MQITSESKKVSLVVALSLLFGLGMALLFPSCANAQRRDTVFQQLVTAGVADGVTPNVTNIGQSQHRVTIILTVVDVMTPCSTSAVDIQWEVSYDNVRFSPAGHPITPDSFGNLANPLTNVMRAKLDGAYPYVRLNYAFDQVNCTIDINYTGTLYPSGDDTSVPQDVPLTGMVTVPINIAVTTDVFTGTNSDYRTCIYAMTLVPAAPVTVTITGQSALGAPGTGPMNLINDAPLVLSAGAVPHFCTGTQGVRITLGAGIQVGGYIMLREEYLPSAF